MGVAPRSSLRGLGRCPHGGPDVAELEALGLQPGEVADFSVNSNPLGCHSEVREAARDAALECYPDSAATALTRALAAHHGCAPDEVLVTSGSLEALRLAAQAYLDPGDVGVVVEPTFGEYALAIALAGGVLERVRLADPPHPGFLGTPQPSPKGAQPPLDSPAAFVAAIAAIACERDAKLLYLCQPNNPTGVYLARTEVERLLHALPATLVVLDEAYVAFVLDAWRSEELLGRPNLLVVRSLTKDHALAGLRVGYALGAAEVLGPLRLVQPAWSVSAPAQAAALAALGHPEHVAAGQALALAERDFLQESLRALGFVVRPSAAHFFLVEVGDAAGLRAALLRRGVQVRDCRSFGLPSFIRIAPRTRGENERLLAALRGVLAAAETVLPSGGTGLSHA